MSRPTVPLTLSPDVQDVVNKVAAVLAVRDRGRFLITGISGAVLRWLEEYLESSDPDNAGNWALPLARRGVMIVVVAMAGMVFPGYPGNQYQSADCRIGPGRVGSRPGVAADIEQSVRRDLRHYRGG